MTGYPAMYLTQPDTRGPPSLLQLPYTVTNGLLLRSVWGNTSKENLDRIHRLQKKAARLILDRESKAPSLPLFQELGWLPIHDRIKFVHATIVFKALNGLLPSFISDLILPLKLPKANTNSGKHTFAFLALVNGTCYWIMLKPHHRFPYSKGTI